MTGPGRLVEAIEVRGVGDVFGNNLDRGVDRSDASAEASLELLDQAEAAHATDEANLAALALQRGGDTDQVGALLFGEDQTGDVVAVGSGRVLAEVEHRGVDDCEVGVGVLGRNRSGVSLEQEAHADHDRVGVSGELQQLSAVRAVVVGRGLAEANTHLGVGTVETLSGGVVERQVAAATDVIDEANGGVRGRDFLSRLLACVRARARVRARVGAGVVIVIAAGRGDQRERKQHRQQKQQTLAHGDFPPGRRQGRRCR